MGLLNAFGVRAATLFFVLLLASCGGGGGGNNNQPPPPPPVQVGLDARPNNQTCVAPARVLSGDVSSQDAFPNLPGVAAPIKALVEPVADPRWFVLARSGTIYVFDPDNATALTPYLNIGPVSTAGEGGLLSMAFHPNYPATPEIFVSYTPGSPFRSVISRITLDNVTTPGAGTTEQLIITVDQDFTNHNGGDIAFGNDGYLYFGLGDGGSGGDPRERAQDRTTLLGSMLRIDVDGTGAGYDIPTDNPYFGNAKCGPGLNGSFCPEIYAWGFRNPWRFSFDRPTGDLWLADVGQDQWEEVDVVVANGNYGWDCREGAHDFETAGCVGPFEEPVSEYSHAVGQSITGGYVYRGTDIPWLDGRYVFGDYVSGRIWALEPDGAGGYTNDELMSTGVNVSAFVIDQDGEVYYLDYGGGRIMKLVPSGGGADPVPDRLSASGCVDPADITQPYSGLFPYGINAPFWSDGADKDRHIGVPNGDAISINAEDDWEFPPGTVIVKNFRLGGQLVETRHLMRHPDGGWAGYTYEWNAAQTEATRVRGGKVANVNGQDWIYPDETECLACHTVAAGRALGPETSQMNRDFLYPQTGRTHGQLETFDLLSMFSSPLQGDPATLPSMPDPMEPTANLGDRARAYLHTNCSQCHRPGGPTPTSLDLRYTTLLANTAACDMAPQSGDLGIVDARIIAPGDASRSVLLARMNVRDLNAMPPIGSNVVDAAGVTLLSDWISGLANCN